MIYSSDRVLPMGCCIIFKTYTSANDICNPPKFTVNFNDVIDDGNYSLVIQSFKFPSMEEFPECPGTIEWMVSNINLENPDGNIIVPYNFDMKEKGKAYIYNTIFTKQESIINPTHIETINKDYISFSKIYGSFQFTKYKVLDTLVVENNNNNIGLFRKSDMLDEDNTLKNPLRKNIINKSKKDITSLIN